MLLSALRSALCHTDKSAKKQKQTPGSFKRFTSVQHTHHQLTSSGGYVCGVAAVAQIVPGHKTRPVCECEEWERMVASEEKGPVMSSPCKIPQIYFGYNYLFDYSKETVEHTSTMHMIHDGTQSKSSAIGH